MENHKKLSSPEKGIGMKPPKSKLMVHTSIVYLGIMFRLIPNSGVQVQVLLFGDCAFSWHRLCGVLIITGYFSTRLNIW